MLSLKVGTFGRTNLFAMRRLRTAFILISLLGASSFSSAQPNPAEIEEMLQDFLADEGVPAIVACTVKGNEITWMDAYGMANIETDLPATVETPFMIASVSKTITGAALQHALNANGIGRNEAINDYLPFEVNHPASDVPITFHMLFTHTAAIDDNWDVMPYCDGDCESVLEEFVEDYYTPGSGIYSASANFHNYAPGTQYNYSNMGVTLAGYCVEAVTGIDFDAYCEEHLFVGLCMENTHWFLNQFSDISEVAMPYYTWNEPEPFPVGHYGYQDYPDGQLRSSARDMGHWMIMWLNEGGFGGNQVMSTLQVNDALSDQFGGDQGLIWYEETLAQTEVWMHNGGDQGVTSDLVIEPESESGFVLISNGEAYHDDLLDTMMEFALSLEPDGSGVPACLTVGISDQGGESMSLYPNPSAGATIVTGVESGTTLAVYSSDGRLVSTSFVSSGRHEFSGFAPGLYHIRSSDPHVKSIRWVVR